jgi:protease-4
MSAAGILLRSLARNGVRCLRLAVAAAALRRRFWLRVRLHPPLLESRPPLYWPGRELPQALLDLLETLEAAGGDPRVAGVWVELAGAPRGLAQSAALRRALAQVRGRGKPVVAYGESLGAAECLVGSAATRLWVPPSASVFLVGLRLDGVFLAGLLERLGVRADVVRVGEYKTAAEPLLRREMSPQQREQLEGLLEDRFQVLVEALAEGRGLAPERVRALVDEGPHPAPAALEAGLVDGCRYRDEAEAELESLGGVGGGADRPVRFVEAPVYHALHVRDPGWWPLFRELPRLAYVVASGTIHRGRGRRGVASDAFAGLLDGLRRDGRVVGVVLRVDSPGGDGVASDLLHHELERLRRAKPVVASMGEVAASGGYYLCAAGDAVLAEGPSLTGSIGVVGGKLDASALYARLGVGRDAVERGARAGLLSEARGFTPGERRALRRQLEHVYETFLDRVARGRRLPLEAVRAAAGGRIVSGSRAAGLGLVDGLGGPLEALAEVRRRAGLEPGERALVEVLPRAPRLGSWLPLAGWLLRALAGPR